jgi:drug/metabolite transporter (DMT)-like permease
MDEKRGIDSFGAIALGGFAVLLAFNQVVVKVTGSGFGPVFQAGLRSALGLGVLGLWMAWRRPAGAGLGPGIHFWGVISGLLFAFEFICMFLALDFSTVSRVSVFFYSMPVWLALAAHYVLPGEQLTRPRAAGLAVAMGGVALAMLYRDGGEASLIGDALSLMAAFGWGAIALCVRMTPLAKVPPATQLVYQLAVSAPILLIAAPFFGPVLREPTALHYWGLAFQAVCIASLGYLFWFWLITIYRASSVASFSFLSPVLAVLMGWLILGEKIGFQVWAALVLVTAGVFLINRK